MKKLLTPNDRADILIKLAQSNDYQKLGKETLDFRCLLMTYGVFIDDFEKIDVKDRTRFKSTRMSKLVDFDNFVLLCKFLDDMTDACWHIAELKEKEAFED